MTVFVHSWFRSGSTWYWAKFRNDSRFRAYYEPLNEELPLWTPERLETAPARAFDGDNHPSLSKHYFYEYRDLIASGRLQFDKGISYERYFLGPKDQDRALKTYLSGLISHAKTTGQRPALCFCRSQLRALWMKANLAGLHIAQVRNPWDQWVSFGKHPYFKNRTLLTAYCIEKRSPGCFSHVSGLDQLFQAWNEKKQATLSDMDCFAAYITIWIASTAQALVASDIVVDIDLLGADKSLRLEVEDALRLNDLPFDLSDCKPPRTDGRAATTSESGKVMSDAIFALRGAGASMMSVVDRNELLAKLRFTSAQSTDVLREWLV